MSGAYARGAREADAASRVIETKLNPVLDAHRRGQFLLTAPVQAELGQRGNEQLTPLAPQQASTEEP